MKNMALMIALAAFCAPALAKTVQDPDKRFSVEIPENWTAGKDPGSYFSEGRKLKIVLSSDSNDTDPVFADVKVAAKADGAYNAYSKRNPNTPRATKGKVGEDTTYRLDVDVTNDNGVKLRVVDYVRGHGTSIAILRALRGQKTPQTMPELEEIIKSIKFLK